MICLLDKQIAENMVKMQMGVQQKLDIEAVIADESSQSVGLAGIEAAGVDDRGLFGIVPNDVGIDREEIEFKTLDLRYICT